MLKLNIYIYRYCIYSANNWETFISWIYILPTIGGYMSIGGVTLSSRRAKRAGWPKGLKGPVGAFRPFGPAGVLRRRLLHRNGNFVPLAP